jgi:exosortase D (VPLPA-CTERM-specific)
MITLPLNQMKEMMQNPHYRPSLGLWLALISAFVLATLAAWDSVRLMVHQWGSSEEYGYGYMIPPLVAFFIWQRKDSLGHIPAAGSWWGFGFTLGGVLLVILGALSTLHSITQYGYVMALMGLIWASLGGHAFRIVLLPLSLLFLMVPLPNFLYANLSSKLQLLSSELGVAMIRLWGISVNLEGNVIDLGNYQLQVVEACSGLRYLFPLVALSIITAVVFKAPIWKRAVVIVSSLPITVLMNSFRIGVIGILVEYWGIKQAEGFIHDFEGWIIFMACTALLVAEIWLLSRIGSNPRPFGEIFALELPVSGPPVSKNIRQAPSLQALMIVALLVLGAGVAHGLSGRVENIPERADFTGFPLRFEGWEGATERIEQIYLDVLKLDDYFNANYLGRNDEYVNLYMAYYGTQRSGRSAHSPSSCLPGGGWRFLDIRQHGTSTGHDVNRVVMQHGDTRQLVYYWFKQRGRQITNEYAVKWYLLWDAIAVNRTDGALIRVMTPLAPGEDAVRGDARIKRFLDLAEPQFARFIPD